MKFIGYKIGKLPMCCFTPCSYLSQYKTCYWVHILPWVAKFLDSKLLTELANQQHCMKIVYASSFVTHVSRYQLNNSGIEELPVSQAMSRGSIFFKNVPFRLGGLWQEGSAYEGRYFSLKVLDLVNLRKWTNWQSHRSGFPAIALNDKTCNSKILLNLF
jgi:hypothetical protein